MIGIFGGTFDPIHKGHVEVIEDFLNRVPIDELIIVPNGLPPHKDKRIFEKDKLRMVELALKHIDKLRIDDREIKKSSPSYAYETLIELQKENPDDDLIWIMGTDSFLEIETWFEYKKFLQEVNIMVLERPGFVIKEESFVYNLLQSKKVEKLSELESSKGHVFLLKINPIEITSTDIRCLIRDGEDVSKFLDPHVYKIIRENKLYERTNDS